MASPSADSPISASRALDLPRAYARWFAAASSLERPSPCIQPAFHVERAMSDLEAQAGPLPDGGEEVHLAWSELSVTSVK